MSKKLIYLLGIIITIIVGAILCYIIHCDCHLNKNNNLDSQKSALINATSNPFSLSDASNGFTINVADNFNFLTSNSSFITPVSKDVLAGVAKIKEQLLKNPSQILTVSGLYKSNEKNTSKFDNLGLARANSIKEYLVSQGISSNQVNTTSELKDSIVADNNNTLFGPLAFSLSNSNGTSVSSTNATSNPFSITDAKSGFTINIADNFNFLTSSPSLITPVSKDVSAGVAKIKEQLLKNPSQILTVSGFYKSNEKNTSKFDNLGLARANSIKEYLVSQGISANQINTRSELKDSIVADDNNTLFGPLAFSLSNTSSNNNIAVKDVIKANNGNVKGTSFVLNFNSGQSSKSLNSSQRQKLNDISKAVKGSSDLKISVVGHTDNVGNSNSNRVLGKKRADYVKSHLLKHGVPSNQVVTSSKGEDVPVATNSTENGRYKNRRIVITIN